MIKNYRLLAINDESLSSDEVLFLTKNKGTSIMVNNSIIKPEIFQFSTAVTDIIKDAYP